MLTSDDASASERASFAVPRRCERFSSLRRKTRSSQKFLLSAVGFGRGSTKYAVPRPDKDTARQRADSVSVRRRRTFTSFWMVGVDIFLETVRVRLTVRFRRRRIVLGVVAALGINAEELNAPIASTPVVLLVPSHAGGSGKANTHTHTHSTYTKIHIKRNEYIVHRSNTEATTPP
jgi:hypothetical protein